YDALLDVTLSGLTVSGGSATIGGGVIDWGENLLLEDMVLTGNTAADQGGALEVISGFNSPLLPYNVTVRDSVVSGNTAVNGGGLALYLDDGVAFGTVLVEGSEISGNDASTNGAGVFIPWHRGNVTFERSTISGNDAGEG